MSDKVSQSLLQKIDTLIKKNNELEKKVFNLINNPEENTSKSFISKKEKELKLLQVQIKQKETEIKKRENKLNMKELELNQRESILNKKESDLLKRELELKKQKPKIIIKEPINKVEKIKDICSHILNSKNISQKELYQDMTVYGTILKKEIEEDLQLHPEKFVKIEDVLKNEDEDFLPSAILAKNLADNNILAVVEKDENKSPVYDIALQFLVNGMVNEKKLVLSYDFGKDQNDLIIYDETEQTKFIEKEKDKLSQVLKVPKDYICICNFRKGSVKIDILLSQKFVNEFAKEFNKEQIAKKPYVDPFINIDENFDNIVKELTKISDAKNVDLKVAPLVEGIRLNPSLFDKAGNKDSGWPEGEKRGNMDYYPPKGWIGHGLRVLGKYDNGDNTWLGMDNSQKEWCVAYHGTNIKFAKSILLSNLKPGVNQVHQYCDNINKRCKLKKVGIGVYVSPLPDVAEGYSTQTNNYLCMFMCRINPNNFRTCEDTNQEYWVVNPTEEDIRPYRLLIKKIDDKI